MDWFVIFAPVMHKVIKFVEIDTVVLINFFESGFTDGTTKRGLVVINYILIREDITKIYL